MDPPWHHHDRYRRFVQFTRSENSTGTFFYQVNSQSDTLYNASYAGCSVVVGTLSPTVLSMNTSNYTPAVNQSFILSGTLRTVNNIQESGDLMIHL